MKGNQGIVLGLLAFAAYLYMMRAKQQEEAIRQAYVYRSEGVYL